MGCGFSKSCDLIVYCLFMLQPGGWACGVNETDSTKILDKFAELGGNFIDTADAYSKGESEKIIGNWLKT